MRPRSCASAAATAANTARPPVARAAWAGSICVATRYGCEMQGATAVAMTNLDVLGYLDEIPVCVAYELNGERVDHFPVTPKLEQCKPIYVKLPGWKCDTRGIKNFDELPERRAPLHRVPRKGSRLPVQAHFQRPAPRRNHLSLSITPYKTHGKETERRKRHEAHRLYKFGHDGRAVSLFPVFLSFLLRRPPFWAAFFLHIWSIDETDAIAYNVRLYT